MRRAATIGGLVGLALLLASGPAHAAIDGPCQASAELDGEDLDVSVDASTTGRVTIPRQADVNYRGEISIPAEDNMSYSGSVTLNVAPGLDLIPGLDDPTIASWSWGGETDAVQTSGAESYDLDLPADIGGGVDATASGSHTQANVTCTGELDVTIAGSVVNPASVGTAVLTAAGAAGLGLAAVGKP